jgi:hypothetical protein
MCTGTTPSSVPSERAFSIQNIIHIKVQNRLTPEKVSMLQYIYLNERVPEREGYNAMAFEDELDLEDAYVVELEYEET